MAHQSDSAVQREAEPLIRNEIETLVGKKLSPMTVMLDSGAPVQVDGVDADQTIFVEIFAHQGALRGGQRHKVATDALKLITLGRSRPKAQLIIAFADSAAAAHATKGTWLSEALATWDIKVYVVELEAGMRDGIKVAQARQVMANPEAPPTSDL
jgi:hypothetical protein